MKRRGVTLVEVMVGATLFLLVTALTFGYLIPATKAANRARVKSHLQQTATVVLAKIREAVSTTSPSGFSWSTEPPVAVAFNPVEELQPSNGLLRWSANYLVFWWEESAETLWTAEFTGTTDSEASILKAKRLSPQRLRDVIGPISKRRTLARGVTRFSVNHAGGDTALIQPVLVEVTLHQPGFSDSPVVDRTLTFRLVNQQ